MNYVIQTRKTHRPIYSNWPCSGVKDSRVTLTSNFYKW